MRFNLWRGRLVAQHKLILAVVIVAMSLAGARSAHAQAAPERARPIGYHVLHGTIAVWALALGLAVDHSGEPDKDWDGFPGDESVRKNQSNGADKTSDWTAALTVASPLVFQFVRGFDRRLANFTTVYGETILTNLAVNSVVKRQVARPRPCAHSCGTKSCASDPGRYASFYSAHSSNTFAAATAGALMLTEELDNPRARGALWAYELGLAAATANMRVKAGKHYYSDVLVGAGVGALFGVGIPLLHGAKPRAFSRKPALDNWGPDLLGMVVGLGAGILTTELASFDGAAAQSTADALALLGSLQVATSGSDGIVMSIGGAL